MNEGQSGAAHGRSLAMPAGEPMQVRGLRPSDVAARGSGVLGIEHHLPAGYTVAMHSVIP
jgi:hypothetical protein